MRWSTARPVDLGIAVSAILVLDALVAAGVEGPLRIVLGLPVVLFIPGYALVAALFPERHRVARVVAGEAGEEEARESEEGLDALERIALSFGLSIAVVPLLGLALNFTPWGIRLVPILTTITLFTLTTCAVAVWRRSRVPPDLRFRLDVRTEPLNWRETSRVDKALTIALALSVVVASGALLYVLTKPRVGERFTEFYILGPGGVAEDYPTNLTVNMSGRVLLGIVNHERETVTYEARMIAERGSFQNASGLRTFVAAGNETLQTWNIPLDDGAKWEENVTFTLPAGEYRLRFELDKPGAYESPYRRLHLFVTVH